MGTKRKLRGYVKIGLSSALLMLAMHVTSLAPVAADSDAVNDSAPVPNSSFVHGTGGYNSRPWYAVGTGGFDGKYSWVKVYVPVNASAHIDIVQRCSLDVGSPRVKYSLIDLKPNEKEDGGAYNSVIYPSTTSPSGGCTSSSSAMSFNIGSSVGAESNILGHEGKRAFFLMAEITNDPTSGDNERSFRFNATTSSGAIKIGGSASVNITGFTDLTTKFFGIYQRDAPTIYGSCSPPNDNGCEWNYRVQFAPSCEDYGNVATMPHQAGTDAHIVFHDADVGVYSPQDLEAVLERKDRTRIGDPWEFVNSWTGLGGNGATVDKTFNANNKYIYRMTVKGINWRNTLQIQIPFDQYDAIPTTRPGHTGCSWDLAGKSQLSPGPSSGFTTSYTYGSPLASGPSNPVYFRHTVTNNGPSDADYTWRVQGQYYADGVNGNGWDNNHYGQNDYASAPPPKCDNPLPSNDVSNVSIGENRPDGTVCGYSFPNDAAPGAKYCQRIYFTAKNGPGTGSDTGNEVCAVLSSTASCGTAYQEPSLVESRTAFKEHFTINYGNLSPPSGGYYKVTITRPDGSTFNLPNLSLNSGGETNGNAASTFANGLDAGSYGVAYGLYDSSNNVVVGGCTGQIDIVSLPYFKIFGSSINAGGGFGCSTYVGSIGGWYNDGAPLNGASVQFNATAMGRIFGFNSAQGTGTRANLTFANNGANSATVDPPPGSSAYSASLGGGFQGSHCLYDKDVPSGATGLPSTQINNLSGKHSYTTGSFTLTGGTVSAGSNLAIFSSGDVYITGNGGIKYGLGTWTYDSATGKWNTPSFMLVAQGDIFIDKNVTELDGIYIANGGNIYTCARGLNSLYNLDELYLNCNQQLQVFGSFIANRVNLMRVTGSLKDAPTDVDPNTGAARACTFGGSAKVCAGEVFNFSPEMYLSDWGFDTTDKNNPNSISALPPVL